MSPVGQNRAGSESNGAGRGGAGKDAGNTERSRAAKGVEAAPNAGLGGFVEGGWGGGE